MLSLVPFLAGCVPAAKPALSFPTVAAGDGLTLDQLRNATYRIDYGTVMLLDGKYEGPPFQPGGAARPRVIFVGRIVARGDLDRDGGDETVVLLAKSSGASGTLNYLAVVAAQDGKPVNIATELLGDRVQLRSMRIAGGQFTFDTVAHGQGDAMCCPTLKVRRTLSLTGDRLVEVGRQGMGTVSVSDLAAVTWMLEEISFGQPVASEPAITFRIENNQVVGSAGCNNYFAPYTSEGSGKINLAAPGATRKACSPAIMDLEAHYLKALEGVTSYSFLAGNLALTYRRDGSFRTLLLTPRVNLRAD